MQCAEALVTPVVGNRYSWYRGPSRILVIGTVLRVSPRSPERWWSRADATHDVTVDPAAPPRVLYECEEEKTVGALSHPGSHWTVPECDFVHEVAS